MSTVRIQVRRGTASQWTSVNPILAAGEMGVESDTNLFKFGNGSSTWTALAYANNSDVAIGEISQDAINTALSMGAGLTKSYNDGTNTIQITVDSTVVALKSYVDTGDAASVSTASADATTKANAAQAAAISAAATDATTKANAARAAAEATAAAALSSLSNTVDTDFVPVSDLGQPNGVATLNASTKIPTSQIDTTIIAERGYVNTQATAAITSAQTYTNSAINNLVNGAPAALDTLAELSAALNDNASYAATITSALALKSPLASPTFTGNVVLPSTTAIGNVDGTEISYLDGVTSGVQSQLDANAYEIGLKAPIASPTFTGTVTLPEGTSIGQVSNIELGYVNGVTSGIQTQLDAKAPLASPTFTGNVTLPSSTTIGSVSNLEMGYLDGATSNLQIQIDAKAPLASPTFTGSVTLPATTSIGLVDSTEMGYLNGVTSGIQVQLDTKAPLANAVFTGTFEAPVATITGAMLANGTVASANIADGTISTIDLADGAVTSAKIANGTIVEGDLADSSVTSAKIANGTIVDGDINAAAGIATSKIAGLDTALGLRATLDGPTFTGTVVLPSTTSIGLVDSTEIGYVNGVTSAIQTQLDAKAPIASPTFTGTVTVAAAGVAFTDKTQTKAGVPSRTPIASTISASTTLAGSLQDSMVPLAGAVAITIGDASNALYAIGESVDFYQASGTGASFAKTGSVNLLYTPGALLRTTYSSATAQKVSSTDWLIYGDLKA